MSIKFINNLVFDIYLKDTKGVNFKNKEELEEYLKKIFKKLNKIYNTTVEGFYDINVYIDKYYGVIFHLEKEELEYYDYFKNQVDMRITIEEKEFLYEVDDLLIELNDKTETLIIDDNIYLKIKHKLTDKEMMILCENSKIVYDY